MSKNYEKKYGKGYLSDVGGNKYWITDDKAYKLTNNDNNNNSNNNGKNNKNGFSFNQIYRLVVGVILIMVLALGFGNGTLDFIQDHKEVYAVENYIKPNITSLADVDGNTFKFNDKVILYQLGANNSNSNDFNLDINLDNLSLITNNTLVFTLHNSSQSYDIFVKPEWTNVNYPFMLNGYLRGFSIRNLSLSLNYYGNYNDDNVLEWSSDFFDNINDDFYITFSNDFSTLIMPSSNNILVNERKFITFINNQTTIKNDIYSDEFFYYDWRFKLHQLSNFRPLFYYDDLNSGMKYSPYLYEERLQEYVDNGDVTFVDSSYIDEDVVLQWKITNYGTNPLSYEIVDFLKYKVSGITGDGDSLNPPPFISGLFILDNGDVRPRESLIGDNNYDLWVERYDNGEYLNANAFGFLDGVFGFLSLPINFTYNIYVFFDFILRW